MTEEQYSIKIIPYEQTSETKGVFEGPDGKTYCALDMHLRNGWDSLELLDDVKGLAKILIKNGIVDPSKPFRISVRPEE